MTDQLQNIGLSHDLAVLIAKSLGVIVLATAGLLWTLLVIWMERKVAGRFQDRPGPNRVGPFGLVQSIADMIKIILKEDIMHRSVDRWVFNLAPLLSVMSVLLIWIIIPFTSGVIGSDLSIGVIYLIGVSSLSTISVLMAGWGSNNKFALLGAFRAVAQMISYEIPMVLSLLVPVLLAGSLRIQGIVEGQHIMYLFPALLSLIIFVVASQAELGRAPFDILEAESELVAGYHVEYSGIKFGMFYVAEFLHAFTVGVLIAVFFLGGWRGPFAEDVPLLGFVYLLLKTMVAYFALLWIRMTFPRVRIDQLLNFGWKFLVPLSLVNLLVVAFFWKLIPDTRYIDSFGDAFVPSLILFLVNVVMIAGVLMILREQGKRERMRLEMRRSQPAGAGD